MAGAAITGVLGLAAPAGAQTPGAPVMPIQGGQSSGPEFTGEAATPDRIRQRWRPPRHPFMAPNGRSNLHNDAFMTDAYRWSGPLGRDIETTSTLFFRECASVTFDSEGRIVTICVGLDRPVLALLDPHTLETLASFPLPPREASGDAFTNFSGGGYFYLDHRDRAVVPTTDKHVYVVGVTPAGEFALKRDYDLSATVPASDGIISVLPDWKGRIWFATLDGLVGWVERGSGAVHSRDLAERNGNSFAVDRRGVYVVSDDALYRFRAKAGKVKTVWRRGYPNTGETKPGQTQAGSGTTPTLIGARNVAITDNAARIHIQVHRRANGALVCRKGVFERGAGSTDQSLIAAGRSLIAENNYGYSITAVQNGGLTGPGLARVDVRRGRCRSVWTSEERAPSVVPKVSLRNGLVYTYTKPPSDEDEDNWYFTALDFDNGETVFKRLAGEGFGFNNHYAPVTIARDGTAYVGVLGGLTLFRDRG